MKILDAVLAVLLVVGDLMALPIWWWLIGSPFGRRRGKHRHAVTRA